MSTTIRPCWIKPDGTIIPCVNWNDHLHEAMQEFPDATWPEGAAVDAGWLKVFNCGRFDNAGTASYCGKPLTHRQRDVVEEAFGLIWSEVEESAVDQYRWWRKRGECVA